MIHCHLPCREGFVGEFSDLLSSESLEIMNALSFQGVARKDSGYIDALFSPFWEIRNRKETTKALSFQDGVQSNCLQR